LNASNMGIKGDVEISDGLKASSIDLFFAMISNGAKYDLESMT